MQPRKFAFTLAIAFFSLLASGSSALAARPADTGNGGSDGVVTPDYGDLVILYRDPDGIPYLTTDSCQQPIAFPSDTCTVDTVDINGDACISDDTPPLVKLDPTTCAITVGCETCTQEVDFGRTNSARSPASVLEAQLEDVIVKLATADCVTLDPAGRMVASTITSDGIVSSTIDSPLQNLAIYKQLMLHGYLGAESAPLTLPGGVLDTMARGIGVASDKAGEVNVDMVVYLNAIMGLTDESVPTVLEKQCIDVKEEVMGVVQLVRKCFLDYGSYGYSRGLNFGGLPAPAYIPADAPMAGWFEYLDLWSVADETTPDLFFVNQGPIMAAAFLNLPGFGDGNIGGFAQSADDTRAVIEFMHSNPIPLGYETPVPVLCDISTDPNYDVSISSDSGLQVPVRMVAGTEGREFTLSVANAGPDAAIGMAEVTAVDANGNAIPTFPRTYDFALVAGTSQSWTEAFRVDYKTTVTWTATAYAEYDVNPGNNSVTEITTVTGGGGGRR